MSIANSEEKLYQTAKNIIKQKIKKIISEEDVRNLDGKIIISNNVPLKEAVKYISISLVQEDPRVAQSEKITREFEYMQQHFDILYKDACKELSNESKKKRSLNSLTDLVKSVQDSMRKDTENTRKTIEALKAFRRASGEKDENKRIECVEIRNGKYMGERER